MKKILFLIALVLGMMTSCTIVDSGEIGIKFKKFSLTEQGELDALPITGMVFYNIFTESVYTYPAYIQQVDYNPFAVNTKDAAIFTMDPLLTFNIDRDKAIYIFSKYRRPLKDISKGYMATCIYDAYRIVANRYTSDELMANRGLFEDEVKSILKETLGNEGFIVKEFTSKIEPPRSLQEAIDAKNKAIQESLRAENEVKKAEADAKIAVAKAHGDAKAMKIKADAEAYYNRTISASLSPMIVQEDWIEKWDGHLPQVQSGQGTMPIINFK